MALSIDQFINAVAASGLVSAADLLTWLSAIPDSERPKNGEELARELVERRKLTKFQAEQIYAGQGASLTLGNYLILDKLGQGGMGLVLKAMHRRMERIVALKVMSQAGMRSPDAVQRFHREVKAAAKLHHPNIVTAFDADEANGTHFLVMEYIEGTDLSALVKKHGPLSIEQAVQYLLQAARGLDFAHSCGVIHRDIKPSNLLVCSSAFRRSDGVLPPEGGTTNVKILDMGLARIDEVTDAQAELTTTGAVMGTVDYMAPEQALSAKFADARSDIYSLGITLWYLLTGRVAYDGDSLIAKVLAHRDASIPSLRNMRADVPAAVDTVFRKMVAKQAKDRYQSMTEVIHGLERCLSGASQGVTLPPNMCGSSSDAASAENSLQGSARPISRDDSAEISPSGTTVESVRMTIPPSAAEAETMLLSAGEGGTDPHTKPSLTLEGSRLQNSAAAGRTNRMRLALFGSIATVVITLLVIVFSRNDQPDQRLRQDDSARTNQGASGPNTVESSGSASPNYALQFSKFSHRVELPALKLEADETHTLEAFVTPANDQVPAKTFGHFVELKDRLTLKMYDENLSSFHARLVQPSGELRLFSVRATKLLKGRRTHVAGVQTAGDIRLFIDGKLMNVAPTEGQGLAETMHLGVLGGGSGSMGFFDGIIDEVRISNTARYDRDFTPETRFQNDEKTLALYHCDEGASLELRDSSGNGQHGRIYGAQWVKVNDPVVAESAPSPAWTDWLRPKLNKGDFSAQFDAREWVREGDAISTKSVISGTAVLPQGTRDGAIRLTYLLRDSKGIEIDARNRWMNGFREMYQAQDNGTQLTILRYRGAGPTYDDLAKQVIPASIPKDAPRTLEFRVVGDTLTATLNGSVVATVKDTTIPDGNFSLVALKGVLVQKVEYQKLDELAPKTTAMSESASAHVSPPSRAKVPFTAMQARTHQEAWAKHLGTTVEAENTVGAKMVLIPPGEFLMGSSDEQITAAAKEMEESTARQTVIDRIQKSERPQHRVVITKPFLMGATEVTLGQFKKFIAATELQTTGEKQATDASSRTYLRPGYPVTDDSPVSVVTWDEATAYCNWLSDREQAVYRLRAS